MTLSCVLLRRRPYPSTLDGRATVRHEGPFIAASAPTDRRRLPVLDLHGEGEEGSIPVWTWSMSRMLWATWDLPHLSSEYSEQDCIVLLKVILHPKCFARVCFGFDGGVKWWGHRIFFSPWNCGLLSIVRYKLSDTILTQKKKGSIELLHYFRLTERSVQNIRITPNKVYIYWKVNKCRSYICYWGYKKGFV